MSAPTPEEITGWVSNTVASIQLRKQLEANRYDAAAVTYDELVASGIDPSLIDNSISIQMGDDKLIQLQAAIQRLHTPVVVADPVAPMPVPADNTMLYLALAAGAYFILKSK